MRRVEIACCPKVVRGWRPSVYVAWRKKKVFCLLLNDAVLKDLVVLFCKGYLPSSGAESRLGQCLRLAFYLKIVNRRIIKVHKATVYIYRY